LTLRRLLGVPPVFALVFAVCEAQGVPHEAGAGWELLGGAALAGIVLLAPTTRTVVAALVAVAVALTAGVVFFDPCTPLGPYIAPPVGLAVFRLTRNPRRRVARTWELLALALSGTVVGVSLADEIEWEDALFLGILVGILAIPIAYLATAQDETAPGPPPPPNPPSSSGRYPLS
jgi:hypothetical protein